MASSPEYVQFVCDQLHGMGDVRFRKMFGDYMVYINDKPVLLVCDNTVYAKILPCVAPLLEGAEQASPYDGAKPHYVLDIEDGELTRQVVTLLEQATPLPRKKTKKKTEPDAGV